VASFLPKKETGTRRDAVKKKQASSHRFWVIPATMCFLLIFTSLGFSTESKQNPLEPEKNSEVDKLEFSLDLTPVSYHTIGQLDLSPLNASEAPKLETQAIAKKEVGPSPPSTQILQDPPKVSNFQNSLYTSSLVTLTALNVADYFSTVQALKHKELEEANPAMKPIAKNIYLFTAVKLGVAALDIYILKNLYKKNKPLAWILSVAANFAMSYVVANNIKMIQSVR
jgi:hypothetical protein